MTLSTGMNLDALIKISFEMKSFDKNDLEYLFLPSEMHDNGDESLLGSLRRTEEEAFQEVQVRFSLI